MTIADPQMWHSCAQLVASTPQTITPTKNIHLVAMCNDTVGKVYVIFNWATGDTEVSTANFDQVVAPGGTVSLYKQSTTDIKVKSLRVVGMSDGYMGFYGK